MNRVDECKNEFHQNYGKCVNMEKGQQREDCYRNNSDEYGKCLSSVYKKAIDEHKERCKKDCKKIYEKEWLRCKTDDCHQQIIRAINICSIEKFKTEVGMYDNRSGIVFW